MKIIYAGEFVREFRKLPQSIQRLYRQQESRFRQSWRDPRLQVKKLKDHPFPFSFRITRRYRVLFIFVDAGRVLFATIGHRREVHRK